MIRITLAVSLILVIVSSALLSQSKSGASFYFGGHDSLLFDGGGDITTIPSSRAGDCYVRVIYANGTTEGTYYVTKTYEICGKLDTMTTTETGQLSPMNELKIGEEIKTGDNSSLEMQFWDGSIIRLGPNSKITITGNMCESQTYVHLVGKMWTNVKKLLGSQKYEVKSERFIIGVRGTQFSVETTNDEDIIKVYEGSVEVKNEMQNKEYLRNSQDNAPEMNKLSEDYQSGKISIEEFMKRMQELQKKITLPGQLVTVNAGFQSRVVGMDNPSEPVPIESSGNEWFDDINFKK